MVDRRKLKGWKRFQPTADDPMKYRVPNPKSTPKEIGGKHGHRPHGKSILWPALYEHLRRKGYSKGKSAAISNSAWKKKRMGIATNTPTSVRGIAKVWFPELSEDGATLSILSSGTPEEGVLKSGNSNPGSPTVQTSNHLLEETMGEKISKDDLPQEVVEYIDALEEHVEEQDEAIAKAQERITALESGKAADDVSKADADLAVILEKADPAVAAVLRKQADDLAAAQEAIAKAAEADTDRTMIAKAEKLPMITTDKDTLKGILKTAYGVSTEYGESVEKLFAAANEQISTANLFTEVGKAGPMGTIASSVEAQAEEIRKADPTLTREQAIAKAYEDNPDLYELALKEG